MITYVVYSHSEYIETLKAQTYYLENYNKKILLIDKNELDIEDVYKSYSRVIFYDSNLPYASRLLALSELKDDYILFIHDIDVVVYKDDVIIESLVSKMREDNIDRIDLQYQDPHYNAETEKIPFNNFFLHKQENPTGCFLYNVNPSIWKLSTLIEIMSHLRNETYRSIEPAAQSFCYNKRYKIYKPDTGGFLKCGYYRCHSFFQFIHLTHGGHFLPLTDNNLEDHLSSEYITIKDTFLKDTKKPFRTSGLF
jgi:hypothetical protein